MAFGEASGNWCKNEFFGEIEDVFLEFCPKFLACRIMLTFSAPFYGHFGEHSEPWAELKLATRSTFGGQLERELSVMVAGRGGLGDLRQELQTLLDSSVNDQERRVQPQFWWMSFVFHGPFQDLNFSKRNLPENCWTIDASFHFNVSGQILASDPFFVASLQT